MVEGLRARDPAAERELWHRFSGFVRSFLMRALGGGGENEDLVQEVFLLLLNDVRRLRNPAALAAFVQAVAQNVLRKEIRRRRLRRMIGLGEPSARQVERLWDSSDPAATLAVRRLFAILDDLEPQERAAYVLRHVDRLELVEVARALDVSLATAKRRIAAAAAVVNEAVAADRFLCDYLGRRSPERGSR